MKYTLLHLSHKMPKRTGIDYCGTDIRFILCRFWVVVVCFSGLIALHNAASLRHPRSGEFPVKEVPTLEK